MDYGRWSNSVISEMFGCETSLLQGWERLKIKVSRQKSNCAIISSKFVIRAF